MGLKIVHLADTHLGFSAYRKITKDGLNQREVDVYDAFRKAVDKILEIKPDLIIHAGDLFDSVRPNNRAIKFALNQLLRISKNNIPMIVIAGNHETPKLSETGHIFSIFEHIENVYPVYNEYRRIYLDLKGKKVSIFCVPQFKNKDEFNDALNSLKMDFSKKGDEDYRILTAHVGTVGLYEFRMNELNEQLIPVGILKSDFDYIALGHFHRFVKIFDNAFYSGSTERFSFTEANEKKGFVEVILEDEKPLVNFIPLETRDMIDFDAIDCTNKNSSEIIKSIREVVEKKDIKDRIVRINLKNVSSHIYRTLDFNELKQILNGALHFDIKTDILEEEIFNNYKNAHIDVLSKEFSRFLENYSLSGNVDKKKLLKMGLKYIEQVEGAKVE
ncbi:MAG: exonuclease SbcCD subunit D [Thermoplasmata archaeon]|nr:exonuclease SbcCD subunit D [Thermoplasmata archaeon]